MRYAILLLFGGMGALLLWLGWVKYQEADGKLRYWERTTAVVSLRGGDGFALRYHAAGEPREAYGSNQLALVPLIEGQRVEVMYSNPEPGQGEVTHWAHLYRDSILIAGFAAIGLFLGIGGFFSFGGSHTPGPASAETALYQQLAEAEEDAPAAPLRLTALGPPVQLREPGGLVILMVIFGLLLILAGGGFLNSTESWLARLVAWPAGVVAIIVGGLTLYTAYETRKTVYHADSNGIRLQSPTRTREVAWTQVAKIVRLRIVQKEWSKTLQRSTTRTAGYTWILSSRSGEELIRLQENLEPRADLQRLLDYIPGRTGVAVRNDSE
ncbi:MAG: hypothetical protein J0L64_19485 [Acidobacteria bacterium]|nr:hypothetical protein [Acidobacteriota bacterium]